jgi:hypothetical protein
MVNELIAGKVYIGLRPSTIEPTNPKDPEADHVR